ncbi:MAG TPA: hypothetical protein VIE65_12425 [Methylobacter sp.]|jgi:hypothetical protein
MAAEEVREIDSTDDLPAGKIFLLRIVRNDKRIGLVILDDGRRVRFEVRRDGISCAVLPPVESIGVGFKYGVLTLRESHEMGSPLGMVLLTNRGRSNSHRLSCLLKKQGRVTQADALNVKKTLVAVFDAELLRRKNEVKKELISLSQAGVDVVALASEVLVSEIMNS